MLPLSAVQRKIMRIRNISFLFERGRARRNNIGFSSGTSFFENSVQKFSEKGRGLKSKNQVATSHAEGEYGLRGWVQFQLVWKGWQWDCKY